MSKGQPQKSKSMKTIRALLPLAVAAFVLATTSLIAGPTSDSPTRTKAVATTKDAAAIKSGDTMVMVCGACKTVSITEYKSAFHNGRPPMQWVEVGAKHECEMCGGSITTVNGKTTDSMQHNCSKCGEGAAFCCVTAPKADKK